MLPSPTLGINSVSRSEHLTHPPPFRAKNTPQNHHTKTSKKFRAWPNCLLKPIGNLLPLMVWKIRVQKTKLSLTSSPEASSSLRCNIVWRLRTVTFFKYSVFQCFQHSLGYKPFRINLEDAHFANPQQVTFYPWANCWKRGSKNAWSTNTTVRNAVFTS